MNARGVGYGQVDAKTDGRHVFACLWHENLNFVRRNKLYITLYMVLVSLSFCQIMNFFVNVLLCTLSLIVDHRISLKTQYSIGDLKVACSEQLAHEMKSKLGI